MGENEEHYICAEPTFSHIIRELNVNVSGAQTRRRIIQAIENRINSKVISYTAAFENPLSGISSKDIMPYEDMLTSIGNVESIALIMHSPGGDPNAAEKIIKMTRSYCENFKFIVPNSAKSAATLISLGADEILMGHLSELGPIDPQITYRLPNGQWVMRPGQSIIDSFQKIKEDIDRSNRLSQAYIPILNNIDIALLDYAEKQRERSGELAKSLLQKYMLKDDLNKASEIATYLADANKHLSHGKLIDRTEALALGLNVTFLDKESDLWKLIWELHCRTTMAVNSGKSIKVIETSTHTLSENSPK